MADRVNTQTAPYPTELADLVDACTYRPGWLVLLRDEVRDPASTHAGETRGLTLSIITETINSYPPHQPMRVRHLFAVPAATYNRESWLRWLFERFLDVERHECMEFFTIGEEKPYAPNHGPGWDPYLITAVATTDLDRRTSFRGEVNPEREPGIPMGECFVCGEGVEFIDGSWRHEKAANYDHHPSRGDVIPTVDSPQSPLTGEEAGLVTGLLGEGRVNPDDWTRAERAAVTRLHGVKDGRPRYPQGPPPGPPNPPRPPHDRPVA